MEKFELTASADAVTQAEGTAESIGECQEAFPVAGIHVIFRGGSMVLECTHRPPHTRPWT